MDEIVWESRSSQMSVSIAQPKPEQWSSEHAAAFQNAGVVALYHHRPDYPPQTFAKLSELMVDHPRRVLDVGCGTGMLARRLARIADHVDAIDISPAMIERGKQLP